MADWLTARGVSILGMTVLVGRAEIDLLVRDIEQLRQPSTDGGMGPARSLRDELPPHY